LRTGPVLYGWIELVVVRPLPPHSQRYLLHLLSLALARLVVAHHHLSHLVVVVVCHPVVLLVPLRSLVVQVVLLAAVLQNPVVLLAVVLNQCFHLPARKAHPPHLRHRLPVLNHPAPPALVARNQALPHRHLHFPIHREICG